MGPGGRASGRGAVAGARQPQETPASLRSIPGYEDRELVVEVTAAGLLIQAEESPPLIDRDWAHAVHAGADVEVSRWEALEPANHAMPLTAATGRLILCGQAALQDQNPCPPITLPPRPQNPR